MALTAVQSNLLDMPVEIVENVAQYLPRKDQLSLASCGRVTYKIIAPMLYYTLQINFRDDKDTSGKSEDGLDMESFEKILAISNQTMEFFREFCVKSLYSRRRNDSFGFAPQRERSIIRDSDHMAVRLVLKRFCNDQLVKIRFQSVTAPRTLARILERQRNTKDLELGDFGDPLDAKYKIPPTLFTSGQLKLASLQVNDIALGSASALLKLIHLSSPTLKSLRLGDPKHHGQSRFAFWVEDSDEPDDEALLSAIANAIAPSKSITLSALERLHIVHDRQFKGFTCIFTRLVHGCTKLRQLRLSGCGNPNMLLASLVSTGSKAIQSIQICYCDSSSRYTETPRVTLKNTTLMGLNSHHTLQLTTFSHTDKGYPDWVNPRALKRLWLSCQYRCSLLPHPNLEIGHSSFENELACTPTRNLFNHLGNSSESISRLSLVAENWPLLEELAIPNPGWDTLPTIPSVKILRLTQEGIPENETHPDMDELHRYLSRLYKFSISHMNQPPALRVLVIDTNGFCNYTEACNQDLVEPPLRFDITFKPMETHCDLTPEGELYQARVATEEAASSLCHRVGCSSYLTLAGRPSPERFWEDG